MSAIESKVNKTGVQKAAKKVEYSPLMEALTRYGYGVRGLIYIVMGLLALKVTLGKGGALASPQGAIAALGKQPAGMILLWVILLGLISYSLWGVVRAVMDPLHKGHDAKGLLARAGYLASAFGYAILIIPTYGYITGASKSANGGQTQKFITTIMAMPLGRWAIGILGLVVVIAGFYQIYQGLSAGFEKQFHTYVLTPKEVKLVTGIGRFGTAARGVVLAIVGGLFGVAAYQANPSQQVGMDTALATILHQPYGVWLLGIVSLGLIAFGIYSILCAVWLRIRR